MLEQIRWEDLCTKVDRKRRVVELRNNISRSWSYDESKIRLYSRVARSFLWRWNPNICFCNALLSEGKSYRLYSNSIISKMVEIVNTLFLISDMSGFSVFQSRSSMLAFGSQAWQCFSKIWRLVFDMWFWVC